MWLYQFCLVLFVINASQCKVCKNNNLHSNGVAENSGMISYKGLTYAPGDDIVELGTTVAEDCDCEKVKCVRKCCPKSYAYDVSTKSCVKNLEDDSILPANVWSKNANFIFSPDVWNDYDQVDGTIDDFNLVSGDLKCNDTLFLRIRLNKYGIPFQLRKDGKLYIKEETVATSSWKPKALDEYCIDTFLVKDANGSITASVDALVCFSKTQDDHIPKFVKSTLMLISCVFILATLGVYAWLPELRNLHGKVLMAYLSCLFGGFILFAALLLSIDAQQLNEDTCVILSIMIYFFLLAAFFWLNIMCFDIWWTFSEKRGLDRLSARARYLVYSLYAFGIPLALTLLVAVLEFTELPAHPLLPMLKRQGCFFYGLSKMIYLYIPILVLCIANIVFCVLTVMIIAKLRSNDAGATHRQRKDTKRFWLYVKLFLMMGVNWIFEVISALYPGKFWIVSDIYNLLIGVIIFILFVCNKKILRLIKRRLNKSQYNSVSKDQKTSSLSGSSNSDENVLGLSDLDGNNK